MYIRWLKLLYQRLSAERPSQTLEKNFSIKGYLLNAHLELWKRTRSSSAPGNYG
jgi:hypothetical protein